MDMVERLDRLAYATIDGWAATWRECFRRACEHDGIDPSSAFVVFSENNPIVPFMDKARNQYLEAVASRQQGGYTGLVITAGKSELPVFKKRRKSS